MGASPCHDADNTRRGMQDIPILFSRKEVWYLALYNALISSSDRV